METQLSKILYIFCLFLFSSEIILCQNKSVIKTSELDICGFFYQKSDTSEIINNFGKPIEIIKRHYNPNIEWGAGGLKLVYKSIIFNYLVYEDSFLESIIIKDSSCLIKTKNGSFCVSSKLHELKKVFPDSYSYYLKKFGMEQKNQTQKFYVNLLSNEKGDSYYGSMVLHIENNIITDIFIQFIE